MKNEKRRLLSVMLAVLVIFFIFEPVTAGTSGGDYSIVDDMGSEVSLEARPERIISLNPAMTEILFALGLDEEIVGVTSYANYPADALKKEKIGTIVDPNLEKIITLHPDLVLAINVNKIETVEKFRSLGIKVAGFDPQTIEDVFGTLTRLGRLTGRTERAGELVSELSAELARLKALVAGEVENRGRPKVFYEIWNDPIYTAGENTFIDNLIELAGGINIGAEAKGDWPQYSLEMLFLEDPDVYIAGPHSSTGLVNEEAIKSRENYQKLKAVKNDRVYIIDQDLVSRPAPRIIEGLKVFIKAFYPRLAAEVDGK